MMLTQLKLKSSVSRSTRTSRTRLTVRAFTESDAKKAVHDFLVPWDAKMIDRLTTKDFVVTHKIKEKKDTLAIVERAEFLERVKHIREAFPDFSWNYKDNCVYDAKTGKVKVQLRKSGCHTGGSFGPPGTGLSPIKATSECFITPPFTAFIKFESGKIKRFDMDQFIEEVGPHGVYKRLTSQEISPLGTYDKFSMDEELLRDVGVDI